MLNGFFRHYFDELRAVLPKMFYFRGFFSCGGGGVGGVEGGGVGEGFLGHICEKVHKLGNI